MTTLSLAHFDGVDGAVVTSDEVAGVTWTLFGTAQLDTAQKKFGASSLLQNLSGGAFTRSTGWVSPHGGDWSEEFFFRLSAGEILLPSFATDEPNTIKSVAIEISQGPQTMAVNYIDSGGSTFLSQIQTVTMAADTWYHAAVVREGNNYSMYFEGNRVETDVDATDVRAMGHFQVFSSNSTDSWYDEHRFSNSAIYTGATYTVPTAPFSILIPIAVPSIISLPNGCKIATWVLDGDTEGQSVSFPNLGLQSLEAAGTWGGGTVTIEGSNEDTPVNFVPVLDGTIGSDAFKRFTNQPLHLRPVSDAVGTVTVTALFCPD